MQGFENQLNIFGENLKICGEDPITGNINYL
jgi:hypothetical protein